METITQPFASANGEQDSWLLPIERGISDEAAEKDEFLSRYAVRLNEGESYFYMASNSGMSDAGVSDGWTDVTEFNENDEMTEGGVVVYGNVEIKAFGSEAEAPEPEPDPEPSPDPEPTPIPDPGEGGGAQPGGMPSVDSFGAASNRAAFAATADGASAGVRAAAAGALGAFGVLLLACVCMIRMRRC